MGESEKKAENGYYLVSDRGGFPSLRGSWGWVRYTS